MMGKMKGFKKERNVLNQRTNFEKAVFILIFILLLAYAITLIYPFLWMIINSLKGAIEYSTVSSFKWPEKLLFVNYIDAFDQLTLENGTTFLGMIFNSVWYTFTSTAVNIFMCSITGYCLSKYNFRLKKYMYALAIFAMTIPIVGTAAAHFKLTKTLGIYDTPIYAVVSSMGSWGFSFLVMYACFSNVSWSYAEATFMDGGGHFTVFFRVMLPQVLGPIATLAVMGMVGHWNDYMTMIMYLPSYPTLSSGLYLFQATAIRGINYPVYFAGLIISIIPILILFSLASDTIMKNMSMGGLKG